MLLTIMIYHYCSSIRVLSSLHVYGFTATCFHVWLTLRMLSFVVDLVLVGSSNVSCAIVIYLSYCYGDQLSFAAFACLLRDPRHYRDYLVCYPISAFGCFMLLLWCLKMGLALD